MWAQAWDRQRALRIPAMAIAFSPSGNTHTPNLSARIVSHLRQNGVGSARLGASLLLLRVRAPMAAHSSHRKLERGGRARGSGRLRARDAGPRASGRLRPLGPASPPAAGWADILGSPRGRSGPRARRADVRGSLPIPRRSARGARPHASAAGQFPEKLKVSCWMGSRFCLGAGCLKLDPDRAARFQAFRPTMYVDILLPECCRQREVPKSKWGERAPRSEAGVARGGGSHCAPVGCPLVAAGTCRRLHARDRSRQRRIQDSASETAMQSSDWQGCG